MYKSRKYFGIVEGVFSKPLKPWTYNERNLSLNFINEYTKGINTYFYCPKDDKYVTQVWDELYPEEEALDLKDFINLCNDKGITFIYGLNPFVADKTDWKYLREKTIEKFNQLRSLGCKNLCLLFDDIPIAYDIVDSKVEEKELSNQLIEFINDIYLSFRKDVDDFWLCSPDYCFKSSSELTISLKSLNKNIGLIWTGNEIFSESITMNDLERIRRLLYPEVRIIYWSNYPVNDCEQTVGTFNLGGFPSLDIEVLKSIDGVVVNPMRECYSNLPFYITFSDYINLGNDYNRNFSWNKALIKLGINEASISIINQFSNPNFVDKRKYIIDDPDQFLDNLDKVEVCSNNECGNLFCKTIDRIFKDALLFKDIYLGLSDNNKVIEGIFKEFDWFPTESTEARWLPEIINILKKRYSLYSSYYKKDLFSNADDLIIYFNKKYIGKDKLNIPDRDKQKFLRCISDTISEEQVLFINLLNNPNIDKIEKLKLSLSRKNLNRFTI